jgi:hypothetical protein
MSLAFWWRLHWIWDHFWQYGGHNINIYSPNLWTLAVFPSSCTFFQFLSLVFIIFMVEVFPFLNVYSQVSVLFSEANVNEITLLICYQVYYWYIKSHSFLYVDFESCYVTEFVSSKSLWVESLGFSMYRRWLNFMPLPSEVSKAMCLKQWLSSCHPSPGCVSMITQTESFKF